MNHFGNSRFWRCYIFASAWPYLSFVRFVWIFSTNISGKNCAHIQKSGVRQSGLHTIDPDGLGPFQVRCDMETDGGGWTVFQRRHDANTDFYREWHEYKLGFGNLADNFWIGLDKLHRLTKSGENVLRVDLLDFDLTSAYANYNAFKVASEREDYKLSLGSYSGKKKYWEGIYQFIIDFEDVALDLVK